MVTTVLLCGGVRLSGAAMSLVAMSTHLWK
jgi:hypothetical protein